MKTSISTKIYLILMLITAATQIGCGRADFSKSGGDQKPADANILADGDLIFINDSFERDVIPQDIVTNTFYGWRGFVVDGLTQVFDFRSNGIGSIIPPAADVGPAYEGNRALYMYGREGSSIENIQLISQSYDLSQYNTVIFNFHWLTFGLNDASDTTPESLQLQVCKGTLNECGANDDALNASGLLSDKWVKVFSSADSTFNDDSLNGKNQTQADWQQGLLAVDLNNKDFVGDSSTFVFRFVSTMRDGLTPGSCTTKCENNCDDHHKCNGHHFDFLQKTNSFEKMSVMNGSSHQTQHKWCNKHHKFDGCHDHDGDHHGDHDDDDDNNCTQKCTEVCTAPDGTLKDGAAIDALTGRATTKTIDEVF